jgi:hypothetical protein
MCLHVGRRGADLHAVFASALLKEVAKRCINTGLTRPLPHGHLAFMFSALITTTPNAFDFDLNARSSAHMYHEVARF